MPLDEALLGVERAGLKRAWMKHSTRSPGSIRERQGLSSCGFFGGLSVEETAEVLEISRETVTRDWKVAKTWLFRELKRTG